MTVDLYLISELYIYQLLRIPFFFFFLKKILKAKKIYDTMLCTKGHVCDIEHIIYSYVRMHMATLQYFFYKKYLC